MLFLLKLLKKVLNIPIIQGFIMLINKSAIMKRFHKDGIQVNILTLNIMDDVFKDILDAMVQSAQNRGIKRIKPSNLHLLYQDIKENKVYQIYLKSMTTIQTNSRLRTKRKGTMDKTRGITLRVPVYVCGNITLHRQNSYPLKTRM